MYLPLHRVSMQSLDSHFTRDFVQNGQATFRKPIMANDIPLPSRGRSVEDYIVDDDCVSPDKFRKTFDIDVGTQIRLVKLLFVRYQHPDLQRITTFLQRRLHNSQGRVLHVEQGWLNHTHRLWPDDCEGEAGGGDLVPRRRRGALCLSPSQGAFEILGRGLSCRDCGRSAKVGI